VFGVKTRHVLTQWPETIYGWGPELPLSSGRKRHVVHRKTVMTTKQIRQFNPNINPKFAEAFLDSKASLPQDMDFGKLLWRTKDLIVGNRIGYSFVWISVFLFILGPFLVTTRPDPLPYVLIVAAVSGLLMGVGLFLQGKRSGKVEYFFLKRLMELEELYGAPLNFYNWEEAQASIKWELVNRAKNVLIARNIDNQELAKAAKNSFKELLGFLVNFSGLSMHGQKEGPYFKQAEIMLDSTKRK